MNLIIDIGNSSTKIAVYDGNVKLTSLNAREFSCEKVDKQLSPYRLDKAIISSVRNTPEFVFDLMTVNIPRVHILSHKSKLPFSLEYDTPETLGSDRIAAAAGACRLFGGENTLVIDAGTAITYDYIEGGIYRGGNISPGIRIRFRALHRYTGRLPLVNPGSKFTSPGKNTADAISAGVITGVIYEINEYIRTFEERHKNLTVVITGGDGELISSFADRKMTFYPDLVTDGLNYLLDYNV